MIELEMTGADQIADILRCGDGQVGSNTFYALPTIQSPRWLLPNNAHAVRSVLRQWRPYGRVNSFGWRLFLIWLATPFWSVFLKKITSRRAGRLPVTNPPGVVAVTYIGTPGVRQKAVCHLVDSHGTIRGILKIPLATGAAEAIAHEVRVLRALQSLPAIKQVPIVLSHDPVTGTAEQTWLPGIPSGRVFGSAHAAFLVSMQQDAYAPTAAKITEVARLIELIPAPAIRARTLSSLVQLGFPDTLPAAWVHGDFTPWNIRIIGNRCAVVDWEEGEECGLPLWDSIHFHATQTWLFRTRQHPWAQMRFNKSWKAYAESTSLDMGDCRKIFDLYCIDRSVRALLDGRAAEAAYFIELIRNC